MTSKTRLSILLVSTPILAFVIVGGLIGQERPSGDRAFRHLRVFDDVVTIELQAVAGLTYALVDDTFTPDGAAGLINDGTALLADVTFLDRFPYLDHPVSGYDVLPLTDASA